MPTLKITIKMDNAAFEECAGEEAARILRDVASYLDGKHLVPSDTAPVRDLNGNTVGEAKVTR
jgi:hypothetical protein